HPCVATGVDHQAGVLDHVDELLAVSWGMSLLRHLVVDHRTLLVRGILEVDTLIVGIYLPLPFGGLTGLLDPPSVIVIVRSGTLNSLDQVAELCRVSRVGHGGCEATDDV